MKAPLRSVRSRSLSLRTVIFLTCVALISACAGAVALITYSTNSGLVLSIAEQSFERSGIETINNTDYLLQPVAAAVEAMTTLIQEDVTAVTNPNLPRFLYDAVRLYPQVYSAYVAAEADGRFVQVQRLDPSAKTWGPLNSPVPTGSRFVLRTVDGASGNRTDVYRYVAGWGEVVGSETVPSQTYDPRGRPFYRAAMDTPQRTLTDIYTFASNGKPGITIAHRLEKNGKPVGVVAADITLERLSQFLAEQPVGQHGLAIIVDAAGGIVAAPRRAAGGAAVQPKTIHDLDMPALDEAWRQSRNAPPTFTFVSGGGDYLAAFRRFPPDFAKDWTIMEVAPVDDFVGQLKTTFRQATVFSFVVACLAGLCSLVVAGYITQPIGALTEEADRIRALTLDGSVAGSSRIREIQHLIESMAAMKTALRTLASEDTDQASVAHLVEGMDGGPDNKLFRKVLEKVELRRARETELSLASAIQHSVLPQAEDEGDRAVKISARMRAAKEIGGDFYDWVWRDKSHVVFVIGDVSGKGIPAALFMASTRTAIRTMIMAGATVAETVESTNRLLSENNDRCFFVTLFIGELDLETGLLTYINAGHEPACVLGGGWAPTDLLPGGPALGVIEDVEFEAGLVRLWPGDTVVALTDGVTDAINRAGQRFGEDRLKQTLDVEPPGAAADIVGRIFTAVDAFAVDELQFDDITCIVLRYDPKTEFKREAA